MTFEWALEGQVLLQRSEIDDPMFPDSLSALSPPHTAGAGFTQHYVDSRGVVRLCEMTLAEGVWTLLRDKPDLTPLAFDQCFAGTFFSRPAGDPGRMGATKDTAELELGFAVTYTKVA